MALSELIKYEGSDSVFVWKYPNEDFNNMTELVVDESQEAIFMGNGQVLGRFESGRYKLDSKNIPFLTALVDKVTGVAVYHCKVFFVNKKVQMAIKWGVGEVRFLEPTLNVPLELGASGEMNLAVSDAAKMIRLLVGTMNGIAWEDGEEKFAKSLSVSFRPMITNAVKSGLPSAIMQQKIDLLEVDAHLDELSEELRKKLLCDFEEYGLTIPQLYLNNILLPENDSNFDKLRNLHLVALQQRESQAERDLNITRSQNREAYMVADIEAQTHVNAAKRKAILEEQMTATEIAKQEAQRSLIQAQAQAQAQQMAGMAEAAVMQAKGYSQKDVLQAEVQKAYAEGLGNMGPAISAGGSSVMGDMLGLGVGMSAMSAMAPQFGEMMKGFAFNAGSAVGAGVPQANQDGCTCPGCGKKLPAGSKFCSECGTKIETISENVIICPKCGKKTPKGKFCIECGSALASYCPGCGKEVAPGAKFCLECGTKIN